MSYLQLSSLFLIHHVLCIQGYLTIAEDLYFMNYAAFSSNFGWYLSTPYYQATHSSVVSWHISNVLQRQNLLLGVDV